MVAAPSQADTYALWHAPPRALGEGTVDRLFTGFDATINAAGNEGGITITVIPHDVNADDDSLTLELGAPEGEPFQNGTYLSGDADEGEAEMDASFGSQSCPGRWFEIKHVAFGAEGVESLWLTFEASCGGVEPIVGEVKFRIPRGGSYVVAPAQIAWPALDLGENPGPQPVTIRSERVDDYAGHADDLRLVGPDASDFEILENGCAASFRAGDTCRIWVDFDRATPGVKTSSLEFRLAQRTHAIPLFAQVVPGKTDLRVRYVDGSNDSSYRYTARFWDIQAAASHTDRTLLAAGIRDRSEWAAERTLYFQSKEGERFAEGRTYRNTRTDATHDSSRRGLDVGWRACESEPAGWLKVERWRLHRSRLLRYAQVTFKQWCREGEESISGTFRYRVNARDSAPPRRVSDIFVSRRAGRWARVRWKVSPSEDVAYYVVRYLRGVRSPLFPHSGHGVDSVTRFSANLPDIRSDESFSVAVYAVDEAGNFGRPRRATFGPASSP